MIPPVVTWADVPAAAVIADCRWYLDGRSGRAEYEAGHAPGAVFVDLDTALAAPPSREGGRHPLPPPEVFAAAMTRIGVTDGTTVVAYDDAGGAIAARLVWLLRALGEEAALLDGGLAAFPGTLRSGPLSDHAQVLRPGAFTPRPWPAERLATIDDATDRSNVVLDARPPQRYRGEVEPVDARPGHIPGALNAPTADNLTTGQHFETPDRLRRRFAGLGIDDAGKVVSSCGSGVTACHNLLALERAGLGIGRLYPGSWSAYAATDHPAATGDAPG